jgi:hypothetical protein
MKNERKSKTRIGYVCGRSEVVSNFASKQSFVSYYFDFLSKDFCLNHSMESVKWHCFLEKKQNWMENLKIG